MIDRRLCLMGIAGGLAAAPAAAQGHHGRFTGQLSVNLDDNGRTLTLTRPFGYIDPAGVAWPVPAGAVVDGASIPQAFWSIVGGPLEGRYRKASVIHDFYCDVRVRPWRQVHLTFFQAMLASGVELPQAKLMYLAVYAGGPRWNPTASANTAVYARPPPPGGQGAPPPIPRPGGQAPEPVPPVSDPARFRQLAAQVQAQDLSVGQIEALVDLAPR
jgi:hypothetical protein